MNHLKIETVEDLVKLIQVVVWAFVIAILMLVFGGIVMSMLYSVIFISQPMKAMSPIDQAFTKMLNDIVLIMASSITTIVSMFAVNKASQVVAEKLAPSLGIPPSTPPASPMPNFNWMGLEPAKFDEEWRAPPPPTTPANYVDPSFEEIARERAAAKVEA